MRNKFKVSNKSPCQDWVCSFLQVYEGKSPNLSKRGSMYGKCPGCVECLEMADNLLVQSVLLMSSSLGVLADILMMCWGAFLFSWCGQSTIFVFHKCIGVTLNASRFRTVSLTCQSYTTILWESKQLLCLSSTRGSETAKSLGRPERKVLVDANAAMWSALNVIISTGAAIDLTEAPSVYADHLVLSAHKNPCVF